MAHESTARSELPVIDMAPLLVPEPHAPRVEVARAIRAACRQFGFFYVSGHGIDPDVLDAMAQAAHRFFALDEDIKNRISMDRGGLAWRGFFPVGGELTSGLPDVKEGLYFGTGLPASDPRVAAGWPLHGANLWPEEVPELEPAVRAYMDGAARAGQALLEGIAMALDLAPEYFARTYTGDPTLLFRIFHYPDQPGSAYADTPSWGVGEHTDYGLLTLLAQDDLGGLQVKTATGWIDAPPIPGTLVCNIGDMLDRLTGGWFRSTPHRVRNSSGKGRLSFPFFLDPDFAAEMKPLPDAAARADGDADTPDDARNRRWDDADLQAFEGTYGDYLLGKVGKVFPDLKAKVL